METYSGLSGSPTIDEGSSGDDISVYSESMDGDDERSDDE